MSQQEVILFCVGGMIAVGKSYYTNLFIFQQQHQYQFLYIDFDEWYAFINGHYETNNFQKSLWKETQQLLKQFIESVITKTLEAKSTFSEFYSKHITPCTNKLNKNIPLIIIVEDNLFYKSMRRDYWDLGRDLQIRYCQFIFVPNSLEECILKNSKRKSPIPESILYDMYQKFEYDSSESSYFKQCHIDTIEELCLIWNNLIQNSVIFPKQSIVVPTSGTTSEEHNLDICTRKLMSHYLNSYPQLRSFAKEINQIRRNHMEQFEQVLKEKYLI